MQWLIFSHIFYDVSTLTWTNYHKFSFVREKNQMFFQNKNSESTRLLQESEDQQLCCG